MANSHDNTKHVRIPLRTATRVEEYAKERGVTRATAYDLIVEAYLSREAPHIITATLDLPEPRRSLPPKPQRVGSG